MGMRKFLDDKVSPHFHEGGKFEKYFDEAPGEA